MNRLALFFSAFRIRFANLSVALLLCLLATSVLFAPPLQADSNSSSSISISNLTITPSAGTVVFDAPWTTEAFAQAQNSFGGFDQQYNSGLGTLVQANAMTQFATGQALADPINLVLNSSATVNLNAGGSASSSGISDMFTTFKITGGSGPVNVTFSAMLNSLQSLMTTGGGILASSEVIFALTVNGNVVLFRDSPLMIGSNSSLELPFSGTLTNSMTLNYNEDYTLFLDPDAEVPQNQNLPEPSTIALLFGGPALAFARRWIMTKRT